MNLRQITPKDQQNLKALYFDSINSIDEKIYCKDQKIAWASQAWENIEFKNSLLKGKGLVLYSDDEIMGFATRFPNDRLSLFYVKGTLCRKGYGTIILNSIEKEANKEGIKKLVTEASLISYRLFIKRKWKVICKENVVIKGIDFERYRMYKNL